MSNRSRVGKSIVLLKGANREISDINEIISSIHKKYNAECGSGFYLIDDIDVAEFYARDISSKYGGIPTINYYEFEREKAKDYIKEAYFNELNERSMRYVGMNISGMLPEDCPKKDRGLEPRNLCHNCYVKKCDWNADYIESNTFLFF